MTEIDGAFVGALTEHRSGEVLNDLGEALRKLTQAVSEIEEPGMLTLKLKISPAEGGSGALIMQDEISLKMPKKATRGSIFFADDRNNLVRNNPSQPELPVAIAVNPSTQTQLPAIEVAQ